MFLKKKTIEVQGIKQVEALKAVELEINQELESIEDFFQKILKISKLKIK